MTLAPFYAAPPIIKAHIVAAMIVVVCTPIQFWWLRQGSFLHRLAGYVWLIAMVIVALTSFWITAQTLPIALGFGPIHILSLLALFTVVRALRHARAGDIKAHRSTVIFLSVGFWVAAAFTLAPTRLVGRMLLG